MEKLAGFANLSPDTVLDAAEKSLGVFLEPVVTPYNSYVNRVYALKDEDGCRYIAKFYRPGRWEPEAIAEEHAFLADCAAAELPVVDPLPIAGELALPGIPTLGNSGGIYFALFPFRGGRTFDLVRDEDYIRAGALAGRLHAVSRRSRSTRRPVLQPVPYWLDRSRSLAASPAMHPDLRAEFLEIAETALEASALLFRDAGAVPESFIRIHGDCHRGNLLEDREGSLILIDFDDMMSGPAIQDLWLLLPARIQDCGREMELLLEGYTEFSHFDRAQIGLVEPLRFMRMVYFLDWCARQMDDTLFMERNPDWGTKAFWIRELEDLRDQARYFI